MIFNAEISIARLLDSIGDIKEEFLSEATEELVSTNIITTAVNKHKKIITIGGAFVSVAAVFVWILQKQKHTKIA